ncbi:MAG: 2-amino-4-hydroxy-6-hydroxymethyldihydropteridine diphosphokinase [Myxococcota bacterium]
MNTLSIIGAGSNLGGRQSILRAARGALITEGIRVLAASPTYRSEAWVLPGDPPGPEFLNEAWRVLGPRDPWALLAILHRVEARFGRIRHRPWAARTLDLDILWGPPYTHPRLEVPHRSLRTRPFALAPLLDVAPKLAPRLRPFLREPPRFSGPHRIEDRAAGLLERALWEPIVPTVVRVLDASIDGLAASVRALQLRVTAVAVLALSPARIRLVLVGSPGDGRSLSEDAPRGLADLAENREFSER